MSLEITPVTPATLSVSAAAAAALSAQASAVAILAVARSSVYNVTEYGAKGDGTTDDTTAIQNCLSDAEDNGVVYFPQGTFYTGELNWRGQSIIGSGIQHTTIQGKAGTDIFVADATLTAYSRQHPYIADFTLTVDDTTDVSGSLSRGGAGNAGFVFEYPDGSVTVPLRWQLANVERLLVQSSSGTDAGRNASCGFYLQIPANLSRFKDLYFYRLKYGWWDHYPTTNLASVEIASDHNHWDSLYFNGCGDAMRSVNVGNSTWTNLTIHSCTNGLTLAGAVSATRSTCYVCNFDGVMIEATVTTPWTIVGEGHTVRNLNISGSHGTITWDASYCVVDGAALKTIDNNPVLTIAGSRNNFRGVYLANNPTTVPTITDNGTRNSVSAATTQKPTITGSRAGNAALADLLTDLAAAGLIVDSTTA